MLPNGVTAVETRYCACGCGQLVKTHLNHNHEPILFKAGHHKVVGGVIKSKVPYLCKQCGKEFHSRGVDPIHCSRACYWKTRGCITEAPTCGWKIKINRMDFKVVTSPRLQRLYVLAKKKACDECGWSKYAQILEVHHVNHNKRDGRWENLRLLCPNCHDVLHLLEKSGRHDYGRYARAKKIREALGLVSMPRGSARTTIQTLVDSGKLQIQ